MEIWSLIILKKVKKIICITYAYFLERLAQVACCCNIPFNIDNALQILDQGSSEHKEKALQRLELYASKLCMKCCVPVVKEEDMNDIQKSTDEYHRFRINWNDQT